MTTVNNVTYTVEKKFNPKTQRSTDIITAQMETGKKLQIGLSFGTDGIWGTADDTIKVIAKDGPFSVNKIAIQQAVTMIKENKVKPGETVQIQTKPSTVFLPIVKGDFMPLNEWEDTYLNNMITKADDFKKIGFAHDQALFLERFMKTTIDEGAKKLVMQNIEVATVLPQEQKTELLNKVFAYAQAVEKGTLQNAAGQSVATDVKDRLDGWTGGWGLSLGLNDQGGVLWLDNDQAKIQSGICSLTSKSVSPFLAKSNELYAGKDYGVVADICNDCKDDDEVVQNTYRHLIAVAAQRMAELGITREQYASVFEKRDMALNFLNQGNDDNSLYNAKWYVQEYLKDLHWIEYSKYEQDKNKLEKELKQNVTVLGTAA